MQIPEDHPLQKLRNVPVTLHLSLQEFYNLVVAMGNFVQKSDADIRHKAYIDILLENLNSQVATSCPEYEDFLEIVLSDDF
jgi:hypothetical protein